jgi:hypothetical protein
MQSHGILPRERYAPTLGKGCASGDWRKLLSNAPTRAAAELARGLLCYWIMPTSKKSAKANGARSEKGIAASYNAVKNFQGQRYTGMRVGRGHTWNYDAGQWKETKVTPDEWTFTYAVTKRRKGHAPEGSGVPVGTEYHWYILAHQVVKKLNANDYSTSLEGTKYKLAHRRADHEKWNISETTQRRHLIKLLQTTLAKLEQETDEAPAVAASTPRPSIPRSPQGSTQRSPRGSIQRSPQGSTQRSARRPTERREPSSRLTGRKNKRKTAAG